MSIFKILRYYYPNSNPFNHKLIIQLFIFAKILSKSKNFNTKRLNIDF